MYRPGGPRPVAQPPTGTSVIGTSRGDRLEPTAIKAEDPAPVALGARDHGGVGESEVLLGEPGHQLEDPRRVGVAAVEQQRPVDERAEHLGHGARGAAGEHGVDLREDGDRQDERPRFVADGLQGIGIASVAAVLQGDHRRRVENDHRDRPAAARSRCRRRSSIASPPTAALATNVGSDGRFCRSMYVRRASRSNAAWGRPVRLARASSSRFVGWSM